MKKFLLRLAYFFIAIFVLACLFDVFISYRLTQSSERKYQQWSGLYQDSINADVIILGNSRALTQYDPSIIDSFLNTNTYVLSFDGSAINRQMIKYENYRRLINHKPKLILQNIDLMTMAVTHGYEREQFFPYFIFDRDLVYSFQIYEKFNFLELYLPCFRYIGYPREVKKALKMYSEYSEPLYKGFYAVDRPYDGSMLKNMHEVNAALDTNMIKKFEEYCTNIKKDSISICFIYAPIYIEATEKMTNIINMYDTYKKIAEQHEIPILDYNYHTISLDSTNFYNATHLNKKGAELFSKQLTKDLDDSLGIIQITTTTKE